MLRHEGSFFIMWVLKEIDEPIKLARRKSTELVDLDIAYPVPTSKRGPAQ